MPKKEPKNCWEFMYCPPEARKECVAYTMKRGRKCWLVASVMCPRVKRDFQHCWECPWFKKLNPDYNS